MQLKPCECLQGREKADKLGLSSSRFFFEEISSHAK